MPSHRLTLAIVDTLEQAHDLQRELSRAGVQAFVTRQEWQGRPRPMVGYFAADESEAGLLDEALAATGIAGEVFRDEPADEVGWSVVFAHPSLQIAHMMRNLLDHHGIEGRVLEAGVRSHEYMGLLEVIHVAVPAGREAAAAEVVDEFLQHMAQKQFAAPALDESESDGDSESESDGDDVLIEWPRCPQCGQPRETMCPKCRHIGHDLPQAETPVDADELAAIRGEPTFVELKNHGERLENSHSQSSPHTDDPLWVLCPVCDWLFQPRFYRRCAWCSHNFGDGLDVVPKPNVEREPINLRMLLVVGGMLALIAAILMYLGTLPRN